MQSSIKNVLSKLAAARLYIKAHQVKKDGTNSFSGYNYFTPEMVSSLVNKACVETNTICVFSLLKDEHGYYGEVSFADMDSGESISTIMRTERPSIKAANETQQMGGMQTYTKRYALMSLFDIEDNAMDFDSHDNTKEQPQQKNTQQATKQAQGDDNKPWLNEDSDAFRAIQKRIEKGEVVPIQTIRQHFRVSKNTQKAIEDIIPNAKQSA